MKNVALILILLTSALSTMAQNKVDFDIHSGLGLGQITETNTGKSISTKLKPGFTGGVGVGLQLSKIFATQLEVNYQVIAGGDGKKQIWLDGYHKSISMRYVSVPLLLKLKIPNSGVGIYAGPQYGYLINTKLKTYDGYAETTNRLRKHNIAATVGAEYYFTIKGGNQLGLSGRYQFSPAHIDKDASKDLHLDNSAFTLTLGYRFIR